MGYALPVKNKIKLDFSARKRIVKGKSLRFEIHKAEAEAEAEAAGIQLRSCIDDQKLLTAIIIVFPLNPFCTEIYNGISDF